MRFNMVLSFHWPPTIYRISLEEALYHGGGVHGVPPELENEDFPSFNAKHILNSVKSCARGGRIWNIMAMKYTILLLGIRNGSSTVFFWIGPHVDLHQTLKLLEELDERARAFGFELGKVMNVRAARKQIKNVYRVFFQLDSSKFHESGKPLPIREAHFMINTKSVFIDHHKPFSGSLRSRTQDVVLQKGAAASGGGRRSGAASVGGGGGGARLLEVGEEVGLLLLYL
ncbi:hypothetical protein OROMI_023258 [Orobanche minor]